MKYDFNRNGSVLLTLFNSVMRAFYFSPKAKSLINMRKDNYDYRNGY